jgi:Fic family protein
MGDKNKFWGGAVIGVAVFVMVSAMWDPRVSLVVSVVALLGLGIWQLAQKVEGKPASATDFGARQTEVKQENLKKVLEFIEGRDKITNDDVQKLLGVSDATAERYLNELEKQGILKQSGENKGTFYTKI